MPFSPKGNNLISGMWLLWLLSFAAPSASEVTNRQRSYLNRLFEISDGRRWINNDGWNTTTPVCQWYGISCDRQGEVMRIELEANNLVGRIPKSIYEFPELIKIDLKNNKIRDGGFEGLKSELVSQKLEELNLAGNVLTDVKGIGSAPASLKFLHFTDNQLSGTFPKELFELDKMLEFYLSFNRFSGTLPTQIDRMTNLERFYLYGNEIEGQLPNEIGSLNRCEVFTMAENRLSGTLPIAVRKMVNLQTFSIHNNEENKGSLSGELRHFQNSPYLTEVRLEGNSFSGTLPASFMMNSNVTDELVTVNLANNNLTGSLPLSLLKFDSLNIDLTGNRMDGTLDKRFCDKKAWMAGEVETLGCDAILCPSKTFGADFGRAKSDSSVEVKCDPCVGNPYLGATSCEEFVFNDWMILATLYRELNGPESWNQTDGWKALDYALENATLAEFDGSNLDYCNWYGIVCMDGKITNIDMTNNGLSGTVPSMLFALTSLEYLTLNHNNVFFQNGMDMTSVSNAPALLSLALTGTRITSLRGLDGATQLKYLYLDGLQELGEESLPTELLALTNLLVLHMQHSNVVGSIPAEIGSLKKLEDLNLYGNKLTGSLPTEMGLLSNLVTLDLSENSFLGTLSNRMVNKWKSIIKLHIHSSKDDTGFTGALPAMNELPKLTELSLDQNQFTGQIPSNFLTNIEDKTTLITVQLNGNKLTGKVPGTLKDFTKMDLSLQNNEITSIDAALCGLKDWMNGEVGIMMETDTMDPCDAILCPAGKFTPYGKSAKGIMCVDCDNKTYTAEYLGSNWCGPDLETDMPMLSLLYKKTAGRYWKNQQNWTKAGVPHCYWEGVTCSETPDGPVTELNLFNFGLVGTIPDSIFKLTKLKLLSLSRNAIDMSFSKLDDAESLVTLKISDTSIRSLDDLDKAGELVTEIHLAGNDLTGTFPFSVTSLQHVKQLFLNNNMFTGTIPETIQNMRSIEQLYLAGNQFTGPLPARLGKLSSLTHLDIELNKLTGNLPTQLNALKQLTSVLLKGQRGESTLGGPLLAFDQTYQLEKLDLSDNKFTGSIPNTFLDDLNGDRAKVYIDLSHNEITGTLPGSLAKFANMFIDLSENRIVEIDSSLCTNNDDWMDGIVGTLSTNECDAILCPAGTALPEGRQTDLNKPCELCEDILVDAPFFGATECASHSNTAEETLLKEFYRRTNGEQWVKQRNWNSDKSVCTWYGVICGDSGVTQIQLESNGLDVGTEGDDLSSLLWDLRGLERLNLKGNNIPLSFKDLNDETKLEEIFLSATYLKSLEGLEKASKTLTTLHITDNDMTGLFPTDLTKLTKLERLYMSFNSFEKKFPPNLGNLSNLKEFYIFGNKITGSMPSNTELKKMTALVEMIAANNYLEGSLPSQISDMPNLEQLSLYGQQSKNKLTGLLPNFVNTPNLWYLDVTDNGLTGEVPSNFMKNSIYFDDDSVSIDLGNNELRGSVPDILANFRSLDLDITGNSFTGLDSKFCEETDWMQGMVGILANSRPCDAIACPPGHYSKTGKQDEGNEPCRPCSLLKDDNRYGQTYCENVTPERDILLELFRATSGERWENSTNWNTNEPICNWFGIECAGDAGDAEGVTDLELEGNDLAGTIPSSIWSLPFLQQLDLKSNEEISLSLDGIEKAADTLELLYLSGIHLESLEGISKASSLKEFHVTDCGLSGGFPEEVFDLADSLESIYIAYNAFSGTLSTRIGELTNLEDFYVFDNEFQGTIPSQIAEMRSLQNMVLAENLLEGQIPSGISELNALKVFSIYRRMKQGPKLTGALPAFDQNPQLVNLYLDNNELTGTIPENFLSSSTNANDIMLSYNKLNGEVPSSLQSLTTDLNLQLEANEITARPDSFCDNKDWMEGAIGAVGCDAFLCPRGTYSKFGRATDDGDICQDCDESNRYMGMTSCESSVNERQILTRFYQATGGADWYESSAWVSSEDKCEWHGIECNERNEVISITLQSNNLVGVPPGSIFDLPMLELIDLSSNPLTNFKFDKIKNAAKLLSLRLDSTGLGSLDGIDKAPALTSLGLRFNGMEGKFPIEIGTMSSLRYIYMSGNKLTGNLPQDSFLGDLKYLRTLRLGNNQFKGQLPSFVKNFALTTLDVSSNQLTSTIPSNFFGGATVTNGYEINLASNQLIGGVPVEMSKLKYVQLYLRDNMIDDLPKEFCSLDGWMDGDVKVNGCDGILCPAFTYSFMAGRRKHDEPCIPCKDKNQYLGTIDCQEPGSISASVTASAGALSLVILLLGVVPFVINFIG